MAGPIPLDFAVWRRESLGDSSRRTAISLGGLVWLRDESPAGGFEDPADPWTNLVNLAPNHARDLAMSVAVEYQRQKLPRRRLERCQQAQDIDAGTPVRDRGANVGRIYYEADVNTDTGRSPPLLAKYKIADDDEEHPIRSLDLRQERKEPHDGLLSHIFSVPVVDTKSSRCADALLPELKPILRSNPGTWL